MTGMLDAIGGTPVVRLERLVEPATRTRSAAAARSGWPQQLERDAFDEVLAVSTADAVAMARRAAREEGVTGPSTGANLVAALDLARRLGQGTRVATVEVDSGLKYLAGDLYAA